MDLVVDDNGGTNVNSVVGAKRSKFCVNTSLSPAFDSPLSAKRCSSNESVYEIVGESINGDSENEICNSDYEADPHKNMNGQVDMLQTSGNSNQNNGSQDPSDSAEMEEEFVIVDDENDASDENNDCNEKASDSKVNSLDCNNMNGILKDFAVEGGKSVPRLSDNGNEIESAVGKNDVTQMKDEKKLDSRVILSSDDEDEIGGLLDEFREVEMSSDENSNPIKTDSVTTTANDKSESSANNHFNASKSLSTGEKSGDVKNNSSAENSICRTNSAIKNNSVSEIETLLNDDKSNDSIIIIDDDDDITKEKSQNKQTNEISQTTIPKLSSPLNSPASFSSSSEDKFEFDSIISDIVNESSSVKANKSDNSQSKSSELSLSDSCSNLLKPLMSNTDSVKKKSDSSSLHKSANSDLNELNSKQLQQNKGKLSSNGTTPSTNFLGETETTQSSLSKINSSENGRRSDTSDQFFNFNGNVSTSSDLSSITRKDKSSDSEAQDDSNCFTTRKLTPIDNDELITNNGSNVSSKHASCDENKDSVDSQMSIVDFPTELLIGKTDQSATSLEVKCNKSSNVSNFEQLKLDNKDEVDSKTKSDVKSDTESKKSNDDIIEGVRGNTSCKYVADEKKSQIKNSDNDGKIDDKEEEKKIGNKIELLNAFESQQSDGQFIWTLHSSGKEQDLFHNCHTKRKPYSNLWFRQIKVRKSGKTKGKSDIYYYPNPNTRLRSLTDVKQYCKREKIPFDPKQYDFCTRAKIRKSISLSSLCKNIVEKMEENLYNICGDHSVMAVVEKIEINRNQQHSGSSKIEKEVKADAQLKVDPCVKSDNSAESKTANLIELENVPSKRKLEDGDNEVNSKKLKTEDEDKKDVTLLNGDINSTSSNDFKLINSKVKDDADEVEAKVLDTVESLLMMLGKPSKKVQVTKNSLDQLALCFSIQPWKQDYKEALNTIKLLEDKLQFLNDVAEKYRTKIAESRDFQRNKFTQFNFRPKVPTRTVGVNVKIYRESEIKKAINATKTKVEGKVCVTPLHTTNMKKENTVMPITQPVRTYENKNMNILPENKSLVSSLQMKDTIISPVISPNQQVVRKPLLPRIITQAARPLVQKVVTLPNSRPPAPPNVTMAGNKFISVGRPPSSNLVFVPSSTITSPSTNQQLQKVVAAGITTTASGTTVGKVNVPGMPGNPNVLVPLKDYLQLLPAGSKGTAVIQPSTRPSLIPPLPSSLVGARTVTYIVPQNSALAGARGIQSFIPSQNQQVQFVLRVTNPGNVPGLNSVVNTVARPQIMQPPLATAPRLQPPMATAPQPQTVAQPQTAQPPRNSGLVLISHTSKPQKSNEKNSDKTILQTYYPGQEDSTPPISSPTTHPAPFPKTQHYPDNKGKAIPPKPSLKGSKNQSGGIVLSWNMSLGNKNANIASYQLFAYQETDGPVDASLWKKVGDVNALPLPMACTLTQFVDKNRYYFTVRAVDVFQRFGPFSDPVSILFEKDGENVKKEK